MALDRKEADSGKPKTAPALAGLRNFAIAAAVALGLRFWVLEPFQIPTGSMEPTLIGREGWGDRIFAGKFSYSKRFGSDPKRWDVVVFYLAEPGAGRKRLVKRLVGLPNETVEISDGDIYIRGEIARKPERVQSVLWHTLYDGRFGDPVERRHWPWRVETGPVEAWGFADGRLVVDNTKPGAVPTTARYDGSERGVGLTNVYIRRSYRAFPCPKCGCEVYYPVDTAHTWVPCPKCGWEFNVVRENMLGVREYNERYPLSPRDEVTMNDLAVEACWTGEGDAGGDVALGIVSRGRHFSARFVPGTSSILVDWPGAEQSQESVRVEMPSLAAAGGEERRMRIEFWDETLAVYWRGEQVWRKEMPARRRLAEMAMDPAQVTVTVGRGRTCFSSIRIERDIYYTLDTGGQHPAMTRSAYGAFYSLGEEEYFFLGDNSPSSRDARFWGAVKRSDLVGRAWFVFWPPNRIRWIE